MIADPYHQSTSTQHMHGSEEVNDNKMKEISGGPREAAELLNTGINHTWDIMGLRGDLQDPVNELEQNRLLWSGGHLKELPQLAHQDTHLGRSERLQLWMWDVQQTLGAQDPIFKEHWDWSWSAGQLLHQEWRGLDISQRSSWTGHRGVPPRFKWTDGYIFEKVRTSVPSRVAEDLEQRRKGGEKLDVAGLIAELHIHFQPGGVFEAAELTKKISEPNVCQKVAAALGELRAWREKVRRAKMLNITLPDVSIRFMAATSIYKDIFDGEKTSPYLRHKWVNLFNTIDFPERVTEADLIKVNEFAIAQLTDLNLRDCGPGEDGLLSTSQRRRERRREQANKVSGQSQFTSVVNVATDAAVKSSCSSSTSSWALPCRFWHGPKHSCKKGIACLFAHSGFEQTHHESAVHRCVTCGSSSHTTKSCTAPVGSNDPHAEEAWAAYRSHRDLAKAPVWQRTRGTRWKKNVGTAPPVSQMASSPSLPPTTSSPTSTSPTTRAPIASTTHERGQATRASRKRLVHVPSAPQKLALLDSGATIGVEYVRRLRPELPTRPVTLANGSSVPGSMYMGPKGIPLCQMISKQEDKQRILPLYWLIDRFCALNSDWIELITPTEREIDIFMFEDLPHIADAEVDNLLKDLPHEGEQGRSGKIAGINNVMHLRLRISANAVRVDGALVTSSAVCRKW